MLVLVPNRHQAISNHHVELNVKRSSLKAYIIVVADVLAPYRHQAISNIHVEFITRRSSLKAYIIMAVADVLVPKGTRPSATAMLRWVLKETLICFLCVKTISEQSIRLPNEIRSIETYIWVTVMTGNIMDIIKKNIIIFKECMHDVMDIEYQLSPISTAFSRNRKSTCNMP